MIAFPEAYLLMIILGGDELKARLQALFKSLKVSDPSVSTPESYPEILMKLKSLLICHASGLGMLLDIDENNWQSKVVEHLIRQPSLCISNVTIRSRANYVPFLK